MSLVHGAGCLPMDRIDDWIGSERAPLTTEREALDDTEREIGSYVASLVDDGATLQAASAKSSTP